MNNKIYIFQLPLDWKLVKAISVIDRFDSAWSAIERNEEGNLKHLKTLATVKSIGSSTRIEGSKMSDEEVSALLENININKLTDRDQQEVAGYFNTLDIISESFSSLDISESCITGLHKILLKPSEKDQWHFGKYKQHSNAVQATYQDGSTQLIFKTTEPGYATEDAVRKLIEWYNISDDTHPIIKTAIFVYEFLSIHPFQDGNGRLSRLITTLLLLKNGYKWIEYVSFEHEIESRKSEYYNVLRFCQANRTNEDISSWIFFFLDCLKNIQNQLMEKLKLMEGRTEVTTRDQAILLMIDSYPGIPSGEISEKTGIPLSTVKRLLGQMVEDGVIIKRGEGRGTNYLIR